MTTAKKRRQQQGCDVAKVITVIGEIVLAGIAIVAAIFKDENNPR
jgi:hypothetical protein